MLFCSFKRGLTFDSGILELYPRKEDCFVMVVSYDLHLIFFLQTNVLHYLTDQSCTLSFIYKKQQFFVPLVFILKVRFLSLYQLQDKFGEGKNSLTLKNTSVFVEPQYSYKLSKLRWTAESFSGILIVSCLSIFSYFSNFRPGLLRPRLITWVVVVAIELTLKLPVIASYSLTF